MSDPVSAPEIPDARRALGRAAWTRPARRAHRRRGRRRRRASRPERSSSLSTGGSDSTAASGDGNARRRAPDDDHHDRRDDHDDAHDDHDDDPAGSPARGGDASRRFPRTGSAGAATGPTTLAYEQRLKELHFDPGPVDGEYAQATEYAVVAVEKLLRTQTRDGVIGPKVKLVLEHFKYKPAKPKAEGDRVEIDLDTQVLTVYKHWQPILITTTSTGSGEHFCGGDDGCQYAITPDRAVPLLLPVQRAGTRASSARCATRTTSTAASPCTASRRCRRTPRRTGARASRWTSPSTSRCS